MELRHHVYVTERVEILNLGPLVFEQKPDGPIVVVGPNGSGKTRSTRNASVVVREVGPTPSSSMGALTNQVETHHAAEYINANRWANVDDMQPTRALDAAQGYTNLRASAGGNYLSPVNEAQSMVLRLAAERSAAREAYVRTLMELSDGDERPPLPITGLDELEILWTRLFPGRRIKIDDWTPRIHTDAAGPTQEYPVNQMSDGEKMAFLLSGRVLTVESSLLVVDEPELHLHPELATRLWDVLEDERPHVTFVYVTHSLPFALSRRRAQYVIARPGSQLETVEIDSALPEDVVMDLMGSATLSIHASRLVFVEGEAGSHDARLYRAWFLGSDTVVRSLGSCHQVVQCVAGMTGSSITAGLEAVGIVDFDFRPLTWAPPEVNVLPLHEIESMLVHPDVVTAVAKHLGCDFDRQEYEQTLRAAVTDEHRRRVVTERWRQNLQWQLDRVAHPIKTKNKTPVEDLESTIPNVFDMTNWPFDPKTLLDEEIARVDSARSGSIDDLLRYFPGKDLTSVLTNAINLKLDAYVLLLCRALSTNGPTFAALQAELEVAFGAWLPSRRTVG
jgi:ABC-type molybdenum transport system ATPase subunit/photorepair protein PhrA